MPAGLTVLALFAQAATAPVGPAAPEQKKTVTTTTAPACPKTADPNSNQIIICAPRIEGYRLNPDVLEARREMRNPGRPKRGGPDLAPYRDCTVGPMGCGPQAGINLLAAWHLQKPFTPSALAEKVRGVLDAPPAAESNARRPATYRAPIRV